MIGRNLARVALWLIISTVLALLYLPLVPPFLFSIGAGTPVAEGEAWTLKGLGATQSQTGSWANARASLTAALRLFEQIADLEQAADTAELLASLSTRPVS